MSLNQVKLKQPARGSAAALFLFSLALTNPGRAEEVDPAPPAPGFMEEEGLTSEETEGEDTSPSVEPEPPPPSPETAPAVEEAAEAPAPAEPAPWSYTFGTDYTGFFVEADPSMSAYASVQAPMSKKWAWFFTQAITKNLIIDASRDEFEWSDGSLGIFVYPRSLIPNVKWLVRLSGTLPWSIPSRHNDVYSRPEIRSRATYPLLEALNVAGEGFLRHTWSKYKTSNTKANKGGYPLPMLEYGLTQSGSLKLWEKFSVGYGASYYEIKYYEQDYTGPNDPVLVELPDQGYSFSLSASVSLLPSLAVSAAYSIGSVLSQPGIDDFAIFDEQEAAWSLGISFSGSYF